MNLGRFSVKKATPLAAVPKAAVAMAPSQAGRSQQPSAAKAETDEYALQQRLLDAKLRIHSRLIDELNLSVVDKIPERELRNQIYELVAQHVLR